MSDPFLEIPAISVTQPIGQFFLCSIPAEKLRAIAYSIPASMTRESGMFSNMFGNQRVQSAPRAKQIGAYIDEQESSFPNTIILSANYDEDMNYAEDEALRWRAVRKADGSFTLTIPTDAKLASIIDGQHRLEGFGYVHDQTRLEMELPCAVYMNLPREYQAKIFATININQKRVDKSLAYQLFGYDLNSSDTDKWPPDMLGVYIARILEGRDNSPFKGHIKLALLEEEDPAVEVKKKTWQVSVACLVEGLTKLISTKPTSDRSKLAQGEIRNRSGLEADASPLRDLYVEGKDKTLLEIVNDYFAVVDRVLWTGQPEKSFITRTVGVLALFDILRDALKAGKINRRDVTGTASDFLRPAAGIDFSDTFFHASGAGRVRIRNVLKFLTGLDVIDDAATVEVVKRLKS